MTADPPGRRLHSPRARRLALGALVLVGAGLRGWGILHGLREGFVYHQDAIVAVHDAWHHHLGAPWRQGHFGLAYGLLLTLAMRSVEAAAGLVGYPPEWSFELIGVAASLLGALLGTATIPAVYLLGRRVAGPAAGLLAAALLAVCPLHSFHSHYPYRDVPMVFFLTWTLLACLALAERPSLVTLVLAAAGAMATTALKTSGFAVIGPILVAALLAARARRRFLVPAVLVLLGGVLAGMAAGGIPTLPGRQAARLGSLPEVLVSFGTFVAQYLAAFGAGLLPGLATAARVLVHWLGLPYTLALAAGVAYGLRRRQPADLVLLAFLVPALVVAAMFPWLDERYLVPLLPAGAAMVGRAVAEGWQASARWRPGRLALGLATAFLLLGALLQSSWQGTLLSLPDTRALAGRWLDAHVPRETRVAVEEYYPLGVNTWPNASFLDPHRPFRREGLPAEVVVTSSLEHQRYLDAPARYPAPAAFITALTESLPLMKSFALQPLGFVHPTIGVYATAPPRIGPGPPPLLPRPYDTGWNGGVMFLDRGPYDRDDRTVWLSGARGFRATLVRREPVDEVAAFVLNGGEPSRLTVRVGWTSRTRKLAPGRLEVLHFRPGWILPTRPALYRYEVGLLPEGTEALVQLRSGAREIGEAYARWGRWDRALPYLERAVAGAPGDVDAGLLLVTAYGTLGRAADAARALARLTAEAPARLRGYRRLAETDEPTESWERAFRQVTGLDPSLLTSALSLSFGADRLAGPVGRPVADPDAPGGASVRFEKPRDPAGILATSPPHLYLPQGAYKARFVLRAWEAAGPEPVAILRVFAETRLLAERVLFARDLPPRPPYVEIAVPFAHGEQHLQVALEVEATGHASLAIDRIRVEPDLREAFRQALRLRAPAAGGTPAATTLRPTAPVLDAGGPGHHNRTDG